MIYKHEVEEVAMRLKFAIADMERLGDRYHNGRPQQIQDAVRHARVSHERVLNLRDHTTGKEALQ
jgi:hypothetical protein